MNTNYSFRSYAIVLIGLLLIIAEGCKKNDEVSVEHATGVVSDNDGNVYKTVKIGSQWWMAENLRVKKYRNGDSIHLAKTNVEWQDTVASYCIYDSLASGLLYNWYAISDARSIVPIGWHIPTDDEWKTLEQNLGMAKAEVDKVNWRGTHEGEKLKVESPKGWKVYGNVWSTNETGFTALPGGCRLFNGVLGDQGVGFWWTMSQNQSGMIWYRYLDYKNANVFRFNGAKTYGFNVRCVKD